MKLINKLVENKNLSMILGSHALGMMAKMMQRVYVLYVGEIVEMGSMRGVFKESVHPYTQLLLKNTPRLSGRGIGGRT